MTPYNYMVVVNSICSDLLIKGIKFRRQPNGSILLKNEANARNDIVFINENGILFFSVGGEKNNKITLIRRDLGVRDRTLPISKIGYFAFLSMMDSNSQFIEKYGWPIYAIPDMAVILCQGYPHFKLVK